VGPYHSAILCFCIHRRNNGGVKTLADFLERPAGEVLIAFGLMGLGAVFYALKLPKGDEVVMAGLTLVSRALISRAVKQDIP
jgi:hypothetical protein